MKKTLLLILSLFSMNLFAAPVTVDSGLCVEIDPFAVGDVCLLLVTAPGASKIGLVFDYDDFLDAEESKEFSIEELEGKTIEVDFDLVKKIKDPNAIRELKSFDDRYFYMNSPVSALSL